MKKTVRLTEGDLVRIIKKVISEQETPPKQKQTASAAGNVSKLSKLKGSNQGLIDKLMVYPINNPEEVFALLKKYGIEPQKNSKFNMSNGDDVNLMGAIHTSLQTLNHYFLRYTPDEKVGEFCKSNTRSFSNMCTKDGIKSAFQPVNPHLSDSVLYEIQRFSQSRCPMIAMLQDRFGYLPNDTTVSGKFNVLISEYVKKLVAAAGYTC